MIFLADEIRGVASRAARAGCPGGHRRALLCVLDGFADYVDANADTKENIIWCGVFRLRPGEHSSCARHGSRLVMPRRLEELVSYLAGAPPLVFAVEFVLRGPAGGASSFNIEMRALPFYPSSPLTDYTVAAHFTPETVI